MTETLDYRRKRLQRWFGAPQTGNLNDESFLDEIEQDVPELRDHLARVRAAKVEDIKDVISDPPPKGFNEVNRPSPNYTRNYKLNSRGILIHASYGSLAGSLSWITQRKSGVSYHVMIGKDGTRYNVVPEHRRAWHAGKSSFRGKYGCNNFLVGVAFSENTYDRTLTDDELASLYEYVKLNKDKYGWKYEWCTDHRTVSPGRKSDIKPAELQRCLNTIRPLFT